MNRKIKNLEKEIEYSSKLYNKVVEVKDSKTGEVTSETSSFVRREKTRDDFVKLFVQNIDFVNKNLSDSALRVLLAMMKFINYQNIFVYNQEFVSYFERNKILGKSSVYRAFQELEEAQVIIKLGDDLKREYDMLVKKAYIINPNIVGKGSFMDIKKLRRTIVQDFDFVNFELSQNITTETIYKDLDEIINNPSAFVIDSVVEEQSENGNIERIITIAEKNDNYDNEIEETKETLNLYRDDDYSVQEHEKREKEVLELKLKLAREENHKAELEIKNKELSIQLLQLQQK
ncbi:hypothetical protein CCZ01_09530 [Helicobacter monodelphidis]|uniref:hypothetical protein n=1 Tax=Helicobacter sp. 15-1451 TaxID=2004995 RepID=UPI000DCC5B35|nr:hypothetical protein [Helicobacter sp. 15-1451]RAX56430.1 hypothetical protein CCZ01_09530 [Helicobacter sp. 15-1451]